MKKYFFLIIILSILFCGQAMATEQTFESKFGKFVVNVPDNWIAETVPEGCKISSKDEKNILSFQLLSAKKVERESIAIKMLRKGKSIEEVQEFTDLPTQRIEQLAIDNRNR